MTSPEFSYTTVFLCPGNGCNAYCINKVYLHWFEGMYNVCLGSLFFGRGRKVKDCLFGQLVYCAKCSGVFDPSETNGFLESFILRDEVMARFSPILKVLSRVSGQKVFFDGKCLSTIDGESFIAFEVIPLKWIVPSNLESLGRNAKTLDLRGYCWLNIDVELFFAFQKRLDDKLISPVSSPGPCCDISLDSVEGMCTACRYRLDAGLASLGRSPD